MKIPTTVMAALESAPACILLATIGGCRQPSSALAAFLAGRRVCAIDACSCRQPCRLFGVLSWSPVVQPWSSLQRGRLCGGTHGASRAATPAVSASGDVAVCVNDTSGPGACESLVRALGPDARSLRPYLQKHLAMPGVAMRGDLFECLLNDLPRWPAAQLGADLRRITQLAEKATPADGPAQAQMLRLLWSVPAQGLPEDVARRAKAAGRALLGRASMPESVVRRYEALFEDGRQSADARDVARSLAEHAFDCRHAPPGDSELDRLPATSARHALAIMSHFARSRSCAGSTMMPLSDDTSPSQLVWQAASLFDHGYPKSLGLQESEAADYSRARTLEKERAYNDMLRFVRESMKNASLSSLSLELLLKIGIDVASNCQPPGSTVSLLRSIITELQRRGGISPENNRVFSHLLSSFQRQKNCTKVSIRDLINAHDYLVPQLLEDFQKSVLFESPSVRSYLVTELSIYAKMARQIPAERRVALLGVATALLTISWPPGKVLDLLIDSASLLQFGSISRQMARKMIPALLRIHTRPYYEWLSPKRKSYLYLTLLRLIEQLDKMDDSILVAIETVVASPCEKLNLVSVLNVRNDYAKHNRNSYCNAIFGDYIHHYWCGNDSYYHYGANNVANAVDRNDRINDDRNFRSFYFNRNNSRYRIVNTCNYIDRTYRHNNPAVYRNSDYDTFNRDYIWLDNFYRNPISKDTFAVVLNYVDNVYFDGDSFRKLFNSNHYIDDREALSELFDDHDDFDIDGDSLRKLFDSINEYDIDRDTLRDLFHINNNVDNNTDALRKLFHNDNDFDGNSL
ncbi:hypothetical protein HPB50_010984 [Hyalomma asiaticum]|uniref:Uncharacterized protein n=1 Tax=Hyalomma asiaticum TaxID=266040 RepID=A0ACB7TIN8_HYAAI|nr:hypothetical protein HPB50_010984 [Hyalomma asiaticum]